MYLKVAVLLNFIDFVLSFDAKMTITLQNSGFHRNLEYKTVFPDLDDGYDFCIQQTLPSSIYISNDQLDDLERLGKLNYYINEVIDIEKPTEKSKPFQIYLYGVTWSTEPIDVPIHFRYHAPSNKTSFVKVDIDYPKLFIEVDANNKESAATAELFKFRCKDSQDLCNWRQIDYDNYTKKPLVAHIPIGNANLKGLITYCTIATSWTVCIYIVIAIINKKNAIKSKLK